MAQLLTIGKRILFFIIIILFVILILIFIWHSS